VTSLAPALALTCGPSPKKATLLHPRPPLDMVLQAKKAAAQRRLITAQVHAFGSK